MHNNKTFKFTSPSPTCINLKKYLIKLAWKESNNQMHAFLTDEFFNFDTEAAEHLEFKHLLAQICAEIAPAIIPKTYWVNDGNWHQLIQTINFSDAGKDLIWILKPSLLNNGQGIKIFANLNELIRHFFSNERFGGDHVLQQYIVNPYLIPNNKGHKFSIRMFMVCSNYLGNFLYPNGYFNVAKQPYQTDQFINLAAHITNEHLTIEPNVIQIPTFKFDFFINLYPLIKAQLQQVLLVIQKKYPNAFVDKAEPRAAIFGMDFLLDTSKNLWLLEANHGPCFPINDEHPLQAYLYEKFWFDFIKTFIEPLQHKSNCSGSLFEKL